jgi:outer membrane protein OmpA-like peptidoglycan-associated protein
VTAGTVNYLGVGTCTLVAHVAQGTNYSSADGSNQSLTVAKAVLYVVPDSKSAVYGGAAPIYNFTLHTGSASGPVVAPVLATKPTCASSYVTTTSPDFSPLLISCSGGSDLMYTLNIGATANLTISWGSVTPLSISFNYNGAKLTKAGQKVLERFASTILSSSYRKVTVIGMVNVGAQGMNVALANRRASVVAGYLISLFSSNPNSKVTVQIAPSIVGKSANQALNRGAVIEPAL